MSFLIKLKFTYNEFINYELLKRQKLKKQYNKSIYLEFEFLVAFLHTSLMHGDEYIHKLNLIP